MNVTGPQLSQLPSSKTDAGTNVTPLGPSFVSVTIVCTECKARNYKTTKRAESASAAPLGSEAGDGAPPVELKKFCKHCQKHTVHKETK